LRFSRLLTVAVLSGSLAAVTGCAATLPPVSDKVASYYDEHKGQKPATATAAPVVAFLGDSYTAGSGAPSGRGWTTLLSGSAGWVERGFGFGGTNYATAGTLPGGTAYVDRVAAVIAAHPDKVIVSGGQNNLGADQSVGIKKTFEGLRGGLPKADIIALSPFWKAAALPPALEEVASQVKASVESVGGRYVNISNPLEGHPELLDADGVHPNTAGHELIAKAVKAALGS